MNNLFSIILITFHITVMDVRNYVSIHRCHIHRAKTVLFSIFC